jgi:hypothetical protein
VEYQDANHSREPSFSLENSAEERLAGFLLPLEDKLRLCSLKVAEHFRRMVLNLT